MPQSQQGQSQVSSISIAAGQEVLSSLQPQNAGLNAVNAGGGTMALFNAEHNSPWVITELYFVPETPNGITIVPLPAFLRREGGVQGSPARPFALDSPRPATSPPSPPSTVRD